MGAGGEDVYADQVVGVKTKVEKGGSLVGWAGLGCGAQTGFFSGFLWILDGIQGWIMRFGYDTLHLAFRRDVWRTDGKEGWIADRRTV